MIYLKNDEDLAMLERNASCCWTSMVSEKVKV